MAIVPKETGVEVFQEQPNAERASEIAHEALAGAASFARYYSLTPKQLPALVLHFKGVKAAYVLPLSSLSPITIDALARELRDRLDDISILRSNSLTRLRVRDLEGGLEPCFTNWKRRPPRRQLYWGSLQKKYGQHIQSEGLLCSIDQQEVVDRAAIEKIFAESVDFPRLRRDQRCDKIHSLTRRTNALRRSLEAQCDFSSVAKYLEDQERVREDLRRWLLKDCVCADVGFT